MARRSVITLLASLLLAASAEAQTTVADYDQAFTLTANDAFVLVDRNVEPTGWRFVPAEGGTADVKSQIEVQIPDYGAPAFVPASPQALYDFWHMNLPAAIDALMVKWRANYSIIGVLAYNTPLWKTLRVDREWQGPSIRSRYRVDPTTGAHVLRLDVLAGP